jgi:hypothetical protein
LSAITKSPLLLTVTINEAIEVNVSISAAPSTTIVAGTNVTFTATPVNGGDEPVYQWKVNGIVVEGQNSSIFSTATLVNGDEVTCELTSNALCATSNPATSNALAMSVNTPPVLSTIGNKTIKEMELFTFNAIANDLDNDPLIFSLQNAPQGAAINAGTGVFTWTPSEVQGPDSYTFTVKVSDGSLTDEEEIMVIVNEVNQIPILANVGNKTVAGGVTLTFALSVTDPDIPWQVLTYSAVPLPSGAIFDPVTGVFLWSPAANQAGNYQIIFGVTDGEFIAQETVTITVTTPGDGASPMITSISPTSGPVGTVVSISGSNFNDVSGVSFNGLPALSFTVESASSIKATVPGGATSGKISVTTNGGTVFSRQNFNVTVPQPPSISSFNPSSGPIGTWVVVSGKNFLESTSVSFAGVAATG